MSTTVEGLSAYDRNWAMGAHLSGLLVFFNIPFGNIIGPLVIYMTVKSDSPFAASNARAALNFQITFALLALVAAIPIIAFFFITIFMLAAVTQDPHNTAFPLGLFSGWFLFIGAIIVSTISNAILCIIGAVNASNGRTFRYPFAIEFVK